MPSKMTTMFKKYIITLQISNYKLKKSVFMADFLLLKNVIKIRCEIDYIKLPVK